LIPRDGGFGLTPNGDGRGGRGNGTFNVPVLIEAADTAPFFHDNSIATLEGAVEFYNSDSFNNSPAGGFVGNIKLEATEVEAVAAFLRVINALENIRSARDLAIRARNSTSQSIADELLKLSIAEIKDAIKVLNCANLHFNGQKELDDAVLALVVAIGIGDDFLRDVAITVGIPHLDAARAELRF
jgi:hypothetical protein